MILSYRDKNTESFALGEFVKAFQWFEDQAAKRLAILNAAPTLDTLWALPSNRPEALRGDRVGQFSIRINRNCASALTGRKGSQDQATLKSWITTDDRRSGHVHESSTSRPGLEGRARGSGHYAHGVLAAD